MVHAPSASRRAERLKSYQNRCKTQRQQNSSLSLDTTESVFRADAVEFKPDRLHISPPSVAPSPASEGFWSPLPAAPVCAASGPDTGTGSLQMCFLPPHATNFQRDGSSNLMQANVSLKSPELSNLQCNYAVPKIQRANTCVPPQCGKAVAPPPSDFVAMACTADSPLCEYLLLRLQALEKYALSDKMPKSPIPISLEQALQQHATRVPSDDHRTHEDASVQTESSSDHWHRLSDTCNEPANGPCCASEVRYCNDSAKIDSGFIDQGDGNQGPSAECSHQSHSFHSSSLPSPLLLSSPAESSHRGHPVRCGVPAESSHQGRHFPSPIVFAKSLSYVNDAESNAGLDADPLDELLTVVHVVPNAVADTLVKVPLLTDTEEVPCAVLCAELAETISSAELVEGASVQATPSDNRFDASPAALETDDVAIAERVVPIAVSDSLVKVSLLADADVVPHLAECVYGSISACESERQAQTMGPETSFQRLVSCANADVSDANALSYNAAISACANADVSNNAPINACESESQAQTVGPENNYQRHKFQQVASSASSSASDANVFTFNAATGACENDSDNNGNLNQHNQFQQLDSAGCVGSPASASVLESFAKCHTNDMGDRSLDGCHWNSFLSEGDFDILRCCSQAHSLLSLSEGLGHGSGSAHVCHSPCHSATAQSDMFGSDSEAEKDTGGSLQGETVGNHLSDMASIPGFDFEMIKSQVEQMCVTQFEAGTERMSNNLDKLTKQVCSIASKLGRLEKRVNTGDGGSKHVTEDSTSVDVLAMAAEAQRIEDKLTTFCSQKFTETAMHVQRLINSNNERIFSVIERLADNSNSNSRFDDRPNLEAAHAIETNNLPWQRPGTPASSIASEFVSDSDWFN